MSSFLTSAVVPLPVLSSRPAAGVMGLGTGGLVHGFAPGHSLWG
jgi:hypothetical protein